MDQWINGSVGVRVNRSDQEMISRPLKRKVWPLLFVTAISQFYYCTPILHNHEIAQPDLIFFLFIYSSVHRYSMLWILAQLEYGRYCIILIFFYFLLQMKLLVIHTVTIVLKMIEIEYCTIVFISVLFNVYTSHSGKTCNL